MEGLEPSWHAAGDQYSWTPQQFPISSGLWIELRPQPQAMLVHTGALFSLVPGASSPSAQACGLSVPPSLPQETTEADLRDPEALLDHVFL